MRNTNESFELNQACPHCLNAFLWVDVHPHSRRIYCPKCGFTKWHYEKRRIVGRFFSQKKPR